MCKNAFVNDADLRKGFVLAYNKLMRDNTKVAKWEKATQDQSPLTRLRAKQLLELSKQEPLTGMVDELAQLVVHEVIIHGDKNYEFTFMDGSKVKVTSVF